jgi:hypothetical protein
MTFGPLWLLPVTSLNRSLVGTLAATQNRKTVNGFAFSVVLSEDGAGRLELTKA